MTTQLIGTNFVNTPAAQARRDGTAPVRSGLVVRREARRNRRAVRAI